MTTSSSAANLNTRRFGVLLHLTSLPGSGPCGDLGWEAFNFVNFLADCGVSLWQMLPIGPPQGGLSPYQTVSAHAGDPRLIGLEPLLRAGWLDQLPADPGQDAAKAAGLHQAYLGFRQTATAEQRHALDHFIETHAHWLEDYALFRAVSEQRQASWWQWPKGLRTRERRALTQARNKLAAELDYIRWEQFVFFEQWAALRAHAQQAGVQLFGDMPIFVAHDSAEVWARPQDFDLNADGSLRVVAGVPPDYFSETGQRWGNPLYRWDQLQASGFQFWVERIQTQLELFDLVRIDHFRGFDAYWEIPATEEYAINGTWVDAPGAELFTHLQQTLGPLPLVAEDLGVITPGVDKLRRDFGLPGMKILQFAFDGGADNPYLPHHHEPDAVIYTGTHDNDTTLGWYQSLSPDEQHHVNEYLGFASEPMPWPLIRSALASVGNLAIVPMQDLLALDGNHRMNRPGTIEGNWGWRFAWNAIPPELAGRLRQLVTLYGRLPQNAAAQEPAET